MECCSTQSRSSNHKGVVTPELALSILFPARHCRHHLDISHSYVDWKSQDGHMFFTGSGAAAAVAVFEDRYKSNMEVGYISVVL